MHYETAEDTALVTAAKDGDIAAFETLVRRYSRAVFAHATRFFGDASTSDDVTQEVFVKVYRSLSNFDERARFSTWLYRIVRNTCLDEVRAGNRRPVPVDPLDSTATGGDFSDTVVLSATVEHAMRGLAPEDRDALSAVTLFGLSYDEAAEALGIPAGTVKSRVFRARRALTATIGITGGGA